MGGDAPLGHLSLLRPALCRRTRCCRWSQLACRWRGRAWGLQELSRRCWVLHDVWLQYTSTSPWALQGVSLHCCAGQTLGICGRTGKAACRPSQHAPLLAPPLLWPPLLSKEPWPAGPAARCKF